jgi:uncharacterized protein (DUF2461 family)
VLKDKKLKQAFGELQEEGKLSRPPKGFDAELKHIEYIKLKNFMVWTECPLKGMDSDEVKRTLLQGFQSALPLVQWLRRIILRDTFCPAASTRPCRVTALREQTVAQ